MNQETLLFLEPVPISNKTAGSRSGTQIPWLRFRRLQFEGAGLHLTGDISSFVQAEISQNQQ